MVGGQVVFCHLLGREQKSYPPLPVVHFYPGGLAGIGRTDPREVLVLFSHHRHQPCGEEARLKPKPA